MFFFFTYFFQEKITLLKYYAMSGANITVLLKKKFKKHKKMRLLAHFISFQDGSVLYTKYITVNKGVHSVSLKRTTVKPAQVNLHVSSSPYNFTYLSEWDLREVSVSNQTGRFTHLLIKFGSPLVHLQHIHFSEAIPVVPQWLQEGSSIQH